MRTSAMAYFLARFPARFSVSRMALAALFAGTLFSQSNALAYFSTIDTGELVAPGEYQVSFEPQYIFTRFSGMNAVARFDTGINDASSVRGVLGFGTVNFQLGGFYKWVPFPDTETQPAIGGEVGAFIARVPQGTEYSFRFHPLLSKRFETEVGDVIPYGSIPLGVTSRPDKTVLPVQLVAGTEFRPLNAKNLSFFGEVGADVNEAFGYVSVAAAWRFDDNSLRGQASPKKKK